MFVGTEWIIDAGNCDAETLRDLEKVRAVFTRVIEDLGLKTVGEENWHKFGGEGGVTGLIMLSESHLTCHTYPEHAVATFNLYCCRTRPEWDWEKNLQDMIGAENVIITKIVRGTASIPLAVVSASRTHTAQAENFDNKRLVSYGEVKIRERGRLPHWEKEDGIYFVTFRLADSLPQNILQNIESEREQISKVLVNLQRELSVEEKNKIDWMFSDKVDEYLDQGIGECYLKNPEIAEIVAGSLRYFDGERYHLFAWCIMPNHVHVVFRAIQKNELEDILHSWKSFTAHKINKLLNRKGEFWQREYYDHLVRDQKELTRIIQYVLDNPAKADLKNWQWIWASGKYKEASAL